MARTQVERSAQTRAALLAAARELFTERGFAGAGREDIAERAGVTRGALYHHFASKTEVAEAVAEELEAELVDRVIAAASAGSSAVDQLHLAARAYMDACTEPAIARILFADAPAVLGLERCRAMSAARCIGLLEVTLARAAAEGVDVPGDPTMAAALVLGMLNEAAALVAAAPDRRRERVRVESTIDVFLRRLLPSSAARSGRPPARRSTGSAAR